VATAARRPSPFFFLGQRQRSSGSASFSPLPRCQGRALRRPSALGTNWRGMARDIAMTPRTRSCTEGVASERTIPRAAPLLVCTCGRYHLVVSGGALLPIKDLAVAPSNPVHPALL